jgi:hypothetical protein
MTDTHPVATLSVGAAIVWSLYAIIALSFGGWVAGRFLPLSEKWLDEWRARLESHFDHHAAFAGLAAAAGCWAGQ